MSQDIKTQLRDGADNIASEGHNGWGNLMTWAADYIEALERELAERQAPKGFAIVPLEPNQAMCNAAYREYLDWSMHSDGDQGNLRGYRRIYKAMVAAAEFAMPQESVEGKA